MKERAVERFLRYIGVDTKSSEESGTHPSSSGQFDLARMLKDELKDIGADEVRFDEDHCYLYAKFKGGRDDLPKIGFIAHMDTSPEAAGKCVAPRIVSDYDGGVIELNKERYLDPEMFPELKDYKGQTLICTDGTTLLGSDDKAGIAEIMTMAERLAGDKDRGDILVAFTPDEEIGEGTMFFDIEGFGADFAYTVDGGGLGELSYENFNAATASIDIMGRNVHPGEAYGKMINALRLACEVDLLVPANERPESTRGREGFFHLISMEGDASNAKLRYLIRDHDGKVFEERKALLKDVCSKVEFMHPGAEVAIDITDSYSNMIEYVRPNIHVVERLERAMEKVKVTPRVEPVRGGTDGATLSKKGLVCPNICAGGHNFHGVYEYISEESMGRICEILIAIVKGDI